MIGPRPWGDDSVRKTVPIVFECRQSWRQSCKVGKVCKVCIAALCTLCNAIKLRRPKQILRQGQADSGGGSVGMQNGACLLALLACVSTLVFSSYTWHCHILTPGAGGTSWLFRLSPARYWFQKDTQLSFSWADSVLPDVARDGLQANYGSRSNWDVCFGSQCEGRGFWVGQHLWPAWLVACLPMTNLWQAIYWPVLPWPAHLLACPALRPALCTPSAGPTPPRETHSRQSRDLMGARASDCPAIWWEQV